MSRLFTIPHALRGAQATASDPSLSAWVSANAGSGKTHVLTQRVLRLLLEGAPPGQILGLTFTKAAAANMASRIFRMLSDWTSLDDEELTAAIVECGAAKPGPAELKFARQLFARTIETPGGLKIQTLHAFCERLLQLFPFEANVPAHFKVLDEREAKELMDEACDRAIVALQASSDLAGALAFVAREAGAVLFGALVGEAEAHAETFASFDDSAGFAAALRARLALAPETTTASVEADMLGGDILRRRRQAWAEALGRGKTRDQEIAAKLQAADNEADPAARTEALLEAFFTSGGEGDPRGGAKGCLTTQGLQADFPGLEEDLHREQNRLIALRDRLRAAQILERSEALFSVAKAILSTFARAKAERGALDFDDQIALALALVERPSAAWVLHKLDYGLDHLLVDEAQDTSAEQWRIVAALTAEFFGGASARSAKRTVFAVGDEKQSIFSFQGAAPDKFVEMKRFFEKRHRQAERPFETVPLNFSFRSAPAILAAVDKTFESEAARQGVAAAGEPLPVHEAIRREMKGVVELWPTVKPMEEPDPEDWQMPLDEPARHDPPVVLAGRIAERIGAWLKSDSPERVIDQRTGGARRIRPGDVMILVRSRSAFFDAMIRALKTKGVGVAGADRLKLREHIAVMDLIAAGRAALTPDDDLTLACVLKSPLIGLDEDELFKLAARRRGPLASAVEASTEGRLREAARRFAIWRKWAGTLTPYAFYARLLGEEGGRKALLSRLGPDAADPIDEFLALALDHEQVEAPSLALFLAEIEATDAAIKRDMETESDGVRVLTVHASKGLEAPIVFLPDTCGSPDGRHDPKLLRLAPAEEGEPPLLAWSGKAAEDCEAVARARADRREAETGEHRRLLYVAMTRAAQRLIVAGFENSKGRAPGCWHDLVRVGLADSMIPVPAFWGEGDAILRFGEGLTAGDEGETEQSSNGAELPAWIRTRAAAEAASTILKPSGAGVAGEGEGVLEGRLVHALLQALPVVPSAARAAAAKAYLDLHGGPLAEEARTAIVARVVAVMQAPGLADLFGPGSRGEVTLAGVLRRPGRPDRRYSGRLDRMLATDEDVRIVDFKLGPPPARPSPAHIAQLAVYRAALRPLYPLLRVRAALVYLEGPTLLRIEDAELEAALDEADAAG
ncbi:MAG TPA: double-strand break repair helicase AddA [Roseiarcus sp.]|nr:double-strand break repair helicase AddA [Roseiarcus sp.]